MNRVGAAAHWFAEVFLDLNVEAQWPTHFHQNFWLGIVSRMAGLTVLVVDDETDVCFIVREMVELLGYHTDYVLSGQEALEYLSLHPVGLVILDTMMPVMDGIEFLSHLRNDPSLKSIPVVIHSAREEQLFRSPAFTAGVQGFLIKSNYGFEELKAVLEKHLGKPVFDDN